MSSDQGVTSSTNNNNNTGFQPVRQNMDNIGQGFENPIQMFAMKQPQQPMASAVTGTIYTGPPAKYLNNNNNNYMRPMLPPQKYVTYNGSSMQQQRRQNNYNNNNNNNGADNAMNDSMNKRKVFVGGLSPDTKVEHLREYFSKFGNVENVTIKYDKSGRSKGFGFVLFEDVDTPNKVYAQDVHIIQGKRVDTKSAHRRDQALARKVFVGGLDPDVTDGEIGEYFSKFGNIAQIEAPIDKIKQKRRPFCFILFENEQSAEEVLKQPRHTISGKSVDCKPANPKTSENNQQSTNMIQQPLAHYNMPALNQNLFQYQPQQRSQQQLQYPQVALAAQQHYPFYNQQTNQQGQTRSQSNRQQLQTNNQPWSPISPAQWQNPNYADLRSYSSYGPSSASASNAAAWQVAPHPQSTSYGQGRSQTGNSTTTPNTNTNSAQYSYPAWNYNQAQASQGPTNQYNYGPDSSNGPPNAFAYQPPTGYDHFSSDSAPPPNYNRQ
jgi:RNA recognition motif-containing protein